MSRNIVNALPELVAQGVLSEAAAAAVKEYYETKERQQPQRINLVFAIIGATLVGLGIILMLAHNWDSLPHTLKVAFSFLPLLLGQLLCGYTLLKKASNISWRESCATFLFFAVGASIALVAQVYHIPGDLASLLLSWMLLCLPVIYLMDSSITSLLYLVGITAFAINDGYGYRADDSYKYWWMLLLVMPHYAWLIRKKTGSNFTIFHHWFVLASLTICLGTLASNEAILMPVAYMALFAVFYIAGTTTSINKQRLLANPFLMLGSLGTMVLLLMFSFKGVWQQFNFVQDDIATPEILVTIMIFLVACWLLLRHLRKRQVNGINPMAFGFIVFAIVYFIGFHSSITGVALMNLLVLAAAIFTIYRGEQRNHLGILNYGLLIIALLVICRFFDTDLSFVIRGLLFVAVGAGFFIANNRLAKKRRKHVS
ncbi:MAG: DUF2157 domain-containing protein [Chitinophagaceae bacterium]|nr:MAG: DUF2157 domain-containing protein [Chitinophagaceae bacterium]